MDYKKLAIKNINTILCGLSLICFFFTFLSAKVEYMGQKESSSISGFEALFEEGGFWGFLVIIALAVVLVFDYVKQLEVFKKIGAIVAPAVAVLGMILTSTTATEGVDDIKKMAEAIGIDVSITNGLGFWLPLIFMILMVAIAVIKYLNLKGNPVFDLINGDAE